MPASASERHPVLITGLGPVTCLGLGLDALVGGVADLTVLQATEGRAVPLRAGGPVPGFDLRDFLARAPEGLELQPRCALASAALAFYNAAVEPDEVRPPRCGLSFASTLGTLSDQRRFLSALSDGGDRPLFPRECPDTADHAVSCEFALLGRRRSFCGDLLCGAEALASAFRRLRRGEADLVLAGGADAAGRDASAHLARFARSGSPPISQGAGLLVLETQDGAERREGFAFCELSSIICRATRTAGACALRELLGEVVAEALDAAEAWAGDVGVVFVSSGGGFHAEAAEAEQGVLHEFSQVPVVSGKRFLGETLAAGFPLECTLAADLLNDGLMPSKVAFQGEQQGVEFWVERQPEPILGDSALVIGCSARRAAAAVLRIL